jgi:hypothetical protein
MSVAGEAPATPSPPEDGTLATAPRGASAVDAVARRARHAGRQLWLAGLGALGTLGATASLPRVASRGRQLRQLMGRLAEKGQPVAERQRTRIDSLNAHASRAVQGAATLLRETAKYEGRRLLERFNLATTEDLRLLAARLEALDKKLDDYDRRIRATAGQAAPSR